MLVCFAIFFIEICLSCYAKDDYLNSFFFYLDLISTATLLLDVGWISDAIFGSSSSSAAAAKVSTKATRLIRILRLIRLIRIVKLYKAAQQHREKKIQLKRKEIMRQKATLERIRMERIIRAKNSSLEENGLLASPEDVYASPHGTVYPGRATPGSQTPRNNLREGLSISKNSNLGSAGLTPSATKRTQSEGFGFFEEGKELDIENEDLLKESNVNKTLSANISKIVIVLILLLMLSVPLFDSSTYNSASYNIQAAGFSLVNEYFIFI